MFAVLDACAVINLLQAFDDDSYFGLIESEFTRVFIAQEKVIEEIHRNKYDNLLTPASKEDERSLQLRRQEIDDIISRRVRNYVFPKDTVECQNFLSKATGYRKKNGEFYSVALSLYLSRMDGVEKICEQLLDVHFVTDDLGVSNDFGTFFRVNQIGNLIDSIDIMTILYLRGRITKADLENFCFTLKSLYSRTHAELIKRIKLAQNVEKDTRISSLLTSIVDYLHRGEIDIWDQVKRSRVHRSARAKYKEIFELVETFVSEGSFSQMERIDTRRKQIEHVWKI